MDIFPEWTGAGAPVGGMDRMDRTVHLNRQKRGRIASYVHDTMRELHRIALTADSTPERLAAIKELHERALGPRGLASAGGERKQQTIGLRWRGKGER